MVKCPFCGSEVNVAPIKEWRFRFYIVNAYICPSCKGRFNYYHGVSSRGKESSFTIRVKPRPKRIAAEG
ncbi:hypothetical protein Desfe_0930 [Desulfurococcus amylolyticus DSM 16532]|uniref:Uncharacterized protein n=2 Tax=Desulfurococcus amylolyticus TaxID=94694 RepID=I3XS94_DESAM|nr:hypothetical protein Desfe_0930 [Desulfurococcus amylolyticus DSM 16532]